MILRKVINRRRWMKGAGSLAASFGVIGARARAKDAPLRFALTPVLLTSDLVMLEALKAYLAHAMGRPVHLVSRRTYQEITALLVTRQVREPATIFPIRICRSTRSLPPRLRRLP